MATIDQVKKHYDKLTARERFALLVAASARDDETERRALLDSAPRVTFSFPHHHGIMEGFDFLTEYHIMQQLGTAGMFFLLTYLQDDPDRPIHGPNGEEVTSESVITLTGRRFLEGLEGYNAVCQEYSIDPETMTETYNLYPELLEFVEIIIRRGFELSETELTDLEATKAAYRQVIETKRADWSETKAR
jgi:hypothetical protein